MSDQAEYWWVSVAGNPCEPAVVKVEEGERRAWTLGCPDAFKLDAPDCPLSLVKKCKVPLRPAEAELAAKRRQAQAAQVREEEEHWQREREARILAGHGYRRF